MGVLIVERCVQQGKAIALPQKNMLLKLHVRKGAALIPCQPNDGIRGSLGRNRHNRILPRSNKSTRLCFGANRADNSHPIEYWLKPIIAPKYNSALESGTSRLPHANLAPVRQGLAIGRGHRIPADRRLACNSHASGTGPPAASTIFIVAKFKPAGSKKPKAAQSKRGFIPCLVVLVIGFVLLSLLFYFVMKSG